MKRGTGETVKRRVIETMKRRMGETEKRGKGEKMHQGFNMKWIVAIICLLITASAFAMETYDVNWPALQEAFQAFLAAPDKEHSRTISELLPPGKHPSHKVESFDSEAAETIFWKLREIEDLVKAGNVHAYKVAFALGGIVDGENALWIAEIKGSGIVLFPKEYLLGVKQYDMTYAWNGDPPCFEAVVVTPDTAKDHKSILDARLKAVETIEDPSLASEMSCTTQILKEYINKDPIY
jgi:hypothetical protein